jgi:hypothetical protein
MQDKILSPLLPVVLLLLLLLSGALRISQGRCQLGA